MRPNPAIPKTDPSSPQATPLPKFTHLGSLGSRATSFSEPSSTLYYSFESTNSVTLPKSGSNLGTRCKSFSRQSPQPFRSLPRYLLKKLWVRCDYKTITTATYSTKTGKTEKTKKTQKVACHEKDCSDSDDCDPDAMETDD